MDLDHLRKCFLTAYNSEAISIVELNLMLLHSSCQITHFNFLPVVISAISQKVIFLDCLFKGLQKDAANRYNINNLMVISFIITVNFSSLRSCSGRLNLLCDIKFHSLAHLYYCKYHFEFFMHFRQDIEVKLESYSYLISNLPELIKRTVGNHFFFF